MSKDQEKKLFVPTMTPEQMKELHEKKGEIAASLIAIKGHPLETFSFIYFIYILNMFGYFNRKARGRG